MRGYPDLNFPEFHKYAAQLRAQGHEVFSPAEVRISQDNIRAIFALETDWLCREAEAVALMPGWTLSLGARAEAALARALGLKIIGVPGFQPTRNLESPFQSEQLFSITSPSLLRKSLKSLLQVKSSTAPKAGIDLNLLTSLTLSFVIILNVAVWIPTVISILLKWLGAL
jgi:hypothetical protein